MRDSGITGLWVWRQRFRKTGGWAKVGRGSSFRRRRTTPAATSRFSSTSSTSRGASTAGTRSGKATRNRLKDHRIYLYRDEVRVYPYGDPDDDWLKIDVTRGTGRAGDFFSNDQLIGWIDITQKGNRT